MEEQPNWAAVAAALDAGDLDLAARRLLTGGFVPSIRRQLQTKFPRLPTVYVDDAVSEAVGILFERLLEGAKIEPSRVGGYIYATARNLVIHVDEEFRSRGELPEGADEAPIDERLVARVADVREVMPSWTARSEAVRFLLSMIDALPSSDSAKQVLRVRFEAAVEGDWLHDAEVAAILGKTATSISSWWRRGLDDLRASCIEHGVDREALEDLAREAERLDAQVEAPWYEDDEEEDQE
jgi:hypothetical protein